jgi:hypothetical protein
MKLEFSGQIFEKKKKSLNIKFLKTRSRGTRDFPNSEADGLDEANSRFFPIFANSRKKITYSIYKYLYI